MKRFTLWLVLCTSLFVSGSCAHAALKATNVSFLLSQVRTSTTSLVAGKVYFYAPGTTTLKTIWLDRDKGSTANNPYTLDANGTAQVYADGLYRVVIKDAAGVTKYDRDNLAFQDPTTSTVELVASDYGTDLSTAVAAIGSTPASLVINTAQTVNADLTIPSTLTIRVTKPGSVTVAVSKTLTFSGVATDVTLLGLGNVVFNGTTTYTNATIGTTGTVAFNGPTRIDPYQIFTSTATATFAASATPNILPEWWGGKADSTGSGTTGTDNTAIFAKAVTAAGLLHNIKLGTGIYRVTATSGNFAITTAAPIVGEGMNVSTIYNSGAGGAVKIAGANYYGDFEKFTIQGNASSEDGLTTSTSTTTSQETAYCNFRSVRITANGRHGLKHRNAWGTRYYSCKFDYNGGLGVFIDSPVNTAAANGVQFYGCEARWNGGTAAGTTYADDKGGVKITGAAAVAWYGGVVESNNAWGFIIGQTAGVNSVRSVLIENVYSELTPNGATVGGFVYAHDQWSFLEVRNCWYAQTTSGGQTAYGIYLTGGEVGGSVPNQVFNNVFRESGNYISVSGAGTNNPRVGMTNDIAMPYTSEIFGKFYSGGAGGTFNVLTISDDGVYVISGTINVGQQGNAEAGVFPFIVKRDNDGNRSIRVAGTSVAGGALATAPTMAFSTDTLQVTIAAGYYATITLSESVLGNGPPWLPTTFTYDPTLFPKVLWRRR